MNPHNELKKAYKLSDTVGIAIAGSLLIYGVVVELIKLQ